MVNSDELRDAICAHHEWLLVAATRRPFPVDKTEIEVSSDRGRAIFGFVDDRGFHASRLCGFTLADDEISVELTADIGKTPHTIKLIRRASAAALAAEIELARLAKADEIGRLISAAYAARLTRVALNAANGRLAQVLFETPDKVPMAAMSDVTHGMTVEAVMTTAMTWLTALGQRKTRPVNDLVIVCEKRQARALQKLHALLNDPWRRRITIAEIDRKCQPEQLSLLPARRLNDLWRGRQKRFVLPEARPASKVAAAVTALAPESIDTVWSKRGETLRFFGLPFVRVRTLGGREKAWFGTGKRQTPLRSETWPTLIALVAELELYRSANTPAPRHRLYRASPEAWLESILRRNISRLDANLILSPIYNQFRSLNDKIDLLALRRDGRLVVIELKTEPDRESVFQAAEYWRKIELQRRRGDLAAANLFGSKTIADRPTLVYLAAPAWSFHRDVEFFTRSLAPEIELWRFDLHERWREAVKVVARTNYERAEWGFTKR